MTTAPGGQRSCHATVKTELNRCASLRNKYDVLRKSPEAHTQYRVAKKTAKLIVRLDFICLNFNKY